MHVAYLQLFSLRSNYNQ